jgi:hypothetical protein
MKQQAPNNLDSTFTLLYPSLVNKATQLVSFGCMKWMSWLG